MKKRMHNLRNSICFLALTCLSSCSNATDGSNTSNILVGILIVITLLLICGIFWYMFVKDKPANHKPNPSGSGKKSDIDKKTIGDFIEVIFLFVLILIVIYRVMMYNKTHVPQTAPARTAPQAYTTVLNTEAYPVLIQPGEKLDWNTNTDCALVYVGTNETNGKWQTVTQTQPVDLGTATYFMFKSCDNVGGTLSYTISPTR